MINLTLTKSETKLVLNAINDLFNDIKSTNEQKYLTIVITERINYELKINKICLD